MSRAFDIQRRDQPWMRLAIADRPDMLPPIAATLRVVCDGMALLSHRSRYYGYGDVVRYGYGGGWHLGWHHGRRW